MGTNESVVTLAMRGDGDEPMSEDSNIKLLQKIVEDQRNIIAEVTGKPAEQTPQVWALYKEVQDYYDRGMRVPDDVTLLLCDDNWGNIRKLPKLQEQHNGGYGVYYHFDYVGGPRNYKWLNTNPLPRIWEQMHLAYRYNANKIWVVNVGDIKPMEFPIQFFLDYAWDPTKIPQDKLDDYTVSWATREFGKNYAKDIADIITLYGKYNGRRKPELLGPDSFSPKLYSLHHYREAEMVVNEYNALAERATTLRDKLPAEYHDAYYQLILYPVLACANLNELYYMTRLNRLYAQQGRVEANALAKRVQSLFARDAALANEYNNQMANGKWNHMMDQHHIGYVGWHDDFKVNKLPELNQLDVTSGSEMAVAVEGSSVVWPRPNEQPLLAFDKNGQQERYIEIFNRKGDPFTFTISAPSSLVISTTGGSVTGQQRVFIKVDWNQIKNPSAEFLLEIKSSSGEEVAVKVICKNPEVPASFKGYVEADGYISIQPEHFSKSVPYGAAEWKVLPDHGRTASAIEVFPVTKSFDPRAGKSPHVQYDINFFNTGKFKIYVMVSPTIDFTAGNGLETAISVDESTPMVLNIHQDNTMRAWEESVKDNIRIISTDITIDKPGRHVLKLWGMDPGVVVQKIIVDTGGLKESYLGPPESNIK